MVVLSATVVFLAAVTASPRGADCERRRISAPNAVEHDLAPELAIPGAVPACRPGEAVVAGTLDFPTTHGPFPGATSPDSLDVAVETTGRIRLTGQEVAGAFGFAPAVDRLSLSSREGPVAIHVEDVGGDGLLDGADVLELFGEAGTTRYDRRRVYRLTVEEDPASPLIQRMVEVAAPASPGDPGPLRTEALFEQRLRYVLNVRNGEEDNLFWTTVIAPNTFNVVATLPAVPVAAAAASLTLDLHGLTTHAAFDPDHHVVVTVNGTAIGELWFDGDVARMETLAVPAGVLLDGANTVALSLPGDTGAPSDAVLLDSVAVGYDRELFLDGESGFTVEAPAAAVLDAGPFASGADLVALDVTDPRRPRRQVPAFEPDGLGGFRARVGFGIDEPGSRTVLLSTAASPSSVSLARGAALLQSVEGADLIVITSPELLAPAERLAAHRQATGLRARVLAMDEIFGAFSGGEVDPSAIRSLVAHAVAEWEVPAPRYVLLLGDGTFDYRNELPPYQAANVVPVALFDSDFNETASDNWFVDLDGDLFPDLPVGRLPAANVAEADVMVDKIIAYETRAFGQGFETRALFVADNAVESWETPYFEELPAELAAELPDYMDITVLQLSAMTPTEMTEAIVDAINEGQVWVNYIGHGSVRTWAQEQIFTTAHVPLLANVEAPAFFVSMTCSNGVFQFPNTSATGSSQRGLAETTLVSPAAAIAFWAASNPSLPDPVPQLNRTLVQGGLGGREVRLGDFVRETLLAASLETPGTADLLRGMVLFGDPSMMLRNNKHPLVDGVAGPTEVVTGEWTIYHPIGARDPDGEPEPLDYRWKLLQKPEQSEAVLGGQENGRFWPDYAGTYVVQIDVSDGLAWSAPASLTVVASGEYAKPPSSEPACGCALGGDGGDGGDGGAATGTCLGALAVAALLVGIRKRHASS